MDQMRHAAKAIENAFQDIELQTYQEVYCSCGWSATSWLRREVEIRAKIHCEGRGEDHECCIQEVVLDGGVGHDDLGL